MKRLVVVGLFVVMMVLTAGSLFAQTAAMKSMPQAPATYPGDTNETIKRRAQWIEGAKKEGALDWWGVLKPDEGYKVIAEFNKTYPF